MGNTGKTVESTITVSIIESLCGNIGIFLFLSLTDWTNPLEPSETVAR